MPSPSNASAASSIIDSGNQYIDALLAGTKWGIGLGSGATLPFSFPWQNGGYAYFDGYNGGDYSSSNEYKAPQHTGLNSLEQSAAINALRAWSNVANIGFYQVNDTASSVGDIRFAFTSAANVTSFWGYAYHPDAYYPVGGDIWINAKYKDDTNWAVGSYNFEALMHEVGHAIGLKHPFEDSPQLSSGFDNRLFTLMSYTDPPKDIWPQAGNINGSYGWITYRVAPETPMMIDILAAQYLYGANYSYNSGNNIYSFDSTKPFFKTIWDGGGVDTISISSFTTDCTIKLNPGSFSTLKYLPSNNTGGAQVTYDGTNNLGIAYNCFIENVISGYGNDNITGNSISNAITGGGGNDVIDGGAGVDRAVYVGNRSEYLIGSNLNQVSDTKTNRDGIDSLTNIERLQFNDKIIAIDIQGNAGQAYRLYKAALNRTPDERGLAGWIKFMDEGGVLVTMAQQFIDSQEFRVKYGLLDNTNFVNQLYQNVLARNGEPSGIAGWVGGLNNGLSRADVLKGFSESSENQANVIGQIKNGIPYVEWWVVA